MTKADLSEQSQAHGTYRCNSRGNLPQRASLLQFPTSCWVLLDYQQILQWVMHTSSCVQTTVGAPSPLTARALRDEVHLGWCQSFV